jgi:AraC-like DNA-binding protein
MALNELDVVVRVAGATLLLWAAFALARQRQDGRAWFIPLALCLAGFLAGNTPDPQLRLSGVAGTLAVFAAGYAAVFLWWWCLAVFDRAFRPRGVVLAVGVVWVVVASVDRGLVGDALAGVGLSWALVGLGLSMVAHLGWRLIRDRENDLIDRRRQARGVAVALAGGQLLADLAVDLILGFDWSPQIFTIAQNATLLGFVGWLLTVDGRLARPRRPAIAARGPDCSAADPVLLARLKTLMEVDRIHTDPALTLDRFVRAMGASERSVRRLINQHLGHDHFRSFLNAHRVEEACRRLTDPDHRNDKLIVVAMDSGFASLASFNRAFRDVRGCAPSAFRAASRSGSEDPLAGN